MKELKEKCLKIKLVIFDVDGVFTNGKFIITENGEEHKIFHAHDGIGIRMLLKHGINVAIITGRSAKAVEFRMQALGITDIYRGAQDKTIPFEELKKKYDLSNEEIAYMGDDIPDWPVMKQVGLRISVPGAVEMIKEGAHYVTKKEGGDGAVREACELILFHE